MYEVSLFELSKQPGVVQHSSILSPCAVMCAAVPSGEGMQKLIALVHRQRQAWKERTAAVKTPGGVAGGMAPAGSSPDTQEEEMREEEEESVGGVHTAGESLSISTLSMRYA